MKRSLILILSLLAACRFPGLNAEFLELKMFYNFLNRSNESRYRISGQVFGLEGTRLRILLRSESKVREELPIAENGSFQFRSLLNDRDRYTVTVSNQPIQPYQQCQVTGGQGSILAADITNIRIICNPGELLPPRFSRPPGEYPHPFQVSLLPRSEAAQIIYTVDGTDPECGLSGSTLIYTAPITFPPDSTWVVRTRSCWNGEESIVDFGIFQIQKGVLQNPILVPNTATSLTDLNVQIVYPGPEPVQIYYSSNFMDLPNCTGSGTLYNGTGVLLTESTNFFAIACLDGYFPSSLTSAAYTINETVVSPVPSTPPGNYQNSLTVALESATPNSTIRYTLDGSDPDCNTGTIGNLVNITSNTQNQIKAIACRMGFNPSPILGPLVYNLEVADLTASQNNGIYQTTLLLSLNSETTGTIIRYVTQVTDPLDCFSGTIYTGPITLPSGGFDYEVKAIGCRNGFTPTPPLERFFTITGQLQNPLIQDDFPNSNQVSLNLGGTPPELTSQRICYTTDGSIPRCALVPFGVEDSPIGGFCAQGSLEYPFAPLTILESITLRARTCSASWTQSNQVLLPMERPDSVGLPQFSIPGGSYSNDLAVSITSTNAIQIYYTTNGEIPNCSGFGNLYDGNPIFLATGVTLRAIGCNSNPGWVNSSIAQANYQFRVANLELFPDQVGLITNSPHSWEVLTQTAGASIYFTTDTSDPICGMPFLYTGSFLYPAGTNAQIRMIGCKSGYLPSPERNASFEVTGTLSQPNISKTVNVLPLGTERVTITGPGFPAGWTICYRTGATDPSCALTPGGPPALLGGACALGSTLYTGSFNIAVLTPIRAITCKNNWISSPVFVN